MIVDSLRDLKESVTALSRNVDAKMSVLVSQREFDHTRDELTIDIGEVRGQIASGLTRHDADIENVRKDTAEDIKGLRDAFEADAQRRRDGRRWMFGAAISLASLLLAAIGLMAALLTQLH